MAEYPPIDVRPDLWRIVSGILQKHVPQYEVWAFGSRAKWTAKRYSDLDLAVITAQPLTLDVSAALTDAFAESDLPWRVDVVDWASTSESFRRIMERDKVVVQNRAGAADSAQAGSWGMGSEVQEHTLESLCLLVADCPHATPKWTNNGVVVLRNQNIKGGRLDLSSPSFTDESHYLGRVRRAAPQENDIVITREAPMGDVCQIPAGLKCCLGQRQVLLRPNPKKVDSRFLLYALQSPYLQHQISWNEGTGSTVSNLRIPVLEALRVPTPSLEAQREIAGTLGSLDDRITLLRETNATLEAIAQALFKSWFVDFDPVLAKMEGRAPEGMDEATAALFPDALEESALGWVPKGWRMGKVGDLAQLKKGTVNPGIQPDTVFEHFSLPAFDDGQRPVIEHGATIKSNKTPVPSDAVLLSKLNPHIPRIWLPGTSGKNAICSTEFLVFQPTATSCRELIYCLFSSTTFIARLRQLVTGTSNSHQRIKPDQVAQIKHIVPTPTVVKAFESLAAPLFKRVHANRTQAQTLATLRDTLLPRLISGQLRLPEAQAEMEASL